MSLLRPEMAVLLFLLPIFILLLISAKRQKQKDLEALVSASLLPRIWQGKKPASRRSVVMLSLAFFFVLLAVLRPSWGYRFETYETAATEIVLALDTSQSMLGADVKPSRLAHAKRKISDFVERARGDRIALVAFAGTAFLQTPLTEDPGAIRMFLDEVDTDLIPVPGSRIDLAIERSLVALGGGKVNKEKLEQENAPSPDSKAIVIITDGETNAQEYRAAALRAAGQGVRIYVLGVGTEDGAPVPESANNQVARDQMQQSAYQRQGAGAGAGFKKSVDGQLVISKLNPALLSEIAQVGNGSYVTSTPDDRDLAALYDRGIKRSLGAGAQGLKREKLPIEAFQWPLVVAFVLLLIDALFSWGMHFSPASLGLRKAGKSTLVALCLVLLVQKNSVSFASDFFNATDRRARKAYEEKSFEAAAKDWKERIANSEENVAPEDYYNLGNALYRSQDYAGAAASFEQAARKYSEQQRAQQTADALHNSGNASLLAGKPQQAIESYQKSLELRPKDEGTLKNLGIARKLLLEQQQQQMQSGENEKSSGSQKQAKEDQQQQGTTQGQSQSQNAQNQDSNDQGEQESKDKTQTQAGQNSQESGSNQSQSSQDKQQNENKSGKENPTGSAADATEQRPPDPLAAGRDPSPLSDKEESKENAGPESAAQVSGELSSDELNKAMNRVKERPRVYLQQKALKEAREQVEKYGSPPKGGQDW